MKEFSYFNCMFGYIVIFTLLLCCFTSLGVVAQVHGADDTSINDTEIRTALDVITENRGKILISICFLLIIQLLIFVYYINSVTRLARVQTAEIEEKRSLLLTLIRYCSIGIAVVDVSDECKQIIFNDVLGKYFGVEPKKVLGTKPFFSKMRKKGGGSLAQRCFRERKMVYIEETYDTKYGEKIHYVRCYPIFESFDERKDIRYIVIDTLDRTKEYEFERELQASLEKFRAFFEKDIIAAALYEPFYSNEKLIKFARLEMNSEWERLVGSSGEHVTEEEPYFLVWVEASNSKKPKFFRNWYIKKSNAYISGCIFYIASEYICVIATDATYVVQLHKNERMLLRQIQTNLSSIYSLNVGIRRPLAEMKTLLAEEEHLFVEAIEKQINSISIFSDQFEKNLISSEKVQQHLMKFYQLNNEDIAR